jgi:hypothetical protein
MHDSSGFSRSQCRWRQVGHRRYICIRTCRPFFAPASLTSLRLDIILLETIAIGSVAATLECFLLAEIDGDKRFGKLDTGLH